MQLEQGLETGRSETLQIEPMERFTVQGDPVFWQHIWWFLGHPEVYLFLVPALLVLILWLLLILRGWMGRVLAFTVLASFMTTSLMIFGGLVEFSGALQEREGAAWIATGAALVGWIGVLALLVRNRWRAHIGRPAALWCAAAVGALVIGFATQSVAIAVEPEDLGRFGSPVFILAVSLGLGGVWLAYAGAYHLLRQSDALWRGAKLHLAFEGTSTLIGMFTPFLFAGVAALGDEEGDSLWFVGALSAILTLLGWLTFFGNVYSNWRRAPLGSRGLGGSSP